MAKVAFGKLGLTKNNEVKTFEFNGQIIEIKQYLSLDEKTQMFERIVSNSIDDNGYYNVTKINFWIDLEIIFSYTNINFTDKQKEDLFKLYDLIKGNGLLTMVKNNMCAEELAEIINTVWKTVKNVYQYSNSALGIMRAITTDYSTLDMEAAEISNKISNAENLDLIKEIINKLG